MLGELFRAKRPCTGLVVDAAYFGLAAMGGFALHDALLRRVAGVSDPRVVQFPPIGGTRPTSPRPNRALDGAIPPDWWR